MIGTCRKCGALIVTNSKCADNETGPAAVGVGLEFMQRVREHFRAEHDGDSWIVAESIGQLAALFPFLAGVEIQYAQRAIVVLTYHALKAQLFGVGFDKTAGKFGVNGDVGGVLITAPVADPLIAAGRVEMLEELIAAGVGGLAPKLEAERAALRAAVAAPARVQLQ